MRRALLVFAALAGCSQPAPEATPTPTPEATATPAPQLPAQAVHAVFDEAIAAPGLPLQAPLHRDAAASPAPAFPTPDWLAADGAPDAVVKGWRQVLGGGAASGEVAVLIEWRLSWGEGASGTARQWGLCSLPCTVEDPFVATAASFPADPLRAPQALFAGRPGAQALALSWSGEALAVSHGGAPMSAGQAVVGQDELAVQGMEADRASMESQTLARHRSLTWVSSEARQVDSKAEAAPQPSVTALLPAVPAGVAEPLRRAVEAVAEVWLWPDADRFQGGFSIKPDPSAVGIDLQREHKRLVWTPRGRDTTDETVKFPTFELTRDGTFGSVSPFPLGATVLASVPAAEGWAFVAARPAMEEVRRAEFVAEQITAFAKTLPPPPGESVSPWVVYVDAAPLVALPGSAGERPWSAVVAAEGRETASIVQAWARLTLGDHGVVRSAATADWIEHATAVLTEAPDPSLYARVFGEAGEDVLGVWREWLLAPEHAGSPDPRKFLGFVRRQIPTLAAELSWKLAIRAFVIDRDAQTGLAIERAEGDDDDSAGDDDDSAGDDDSAPAAPEAPTPTPTPTDDPLWPLTGEADALRLVVHPVELPRNARLGVAPLRTPQVVPRWAAANLPPETTWEQLQADPEARARFVTTLKESPTGVDLLAGPAVVVVEAGQAWNMTLTLDPPTAE